VKGMAKEYDPTPPGVVEVKFITKRGKVKATCKEDGWSTSGRSEAEVAREVGTHMAGRHQGQTLRKT
jgi:predicted small metal-binding protein